MSYGSIFIEAIFLFFSQSTFNNPEWFYRHVDNHVESAEPQSLPQQQQALFCHWTGMTDDELKDVLCYVAIYISCFCYRLRCILQDQVSSERTHAEPHTGETRSLSHVWQHVLQQHKAV